METKHTPGPWTMAEKPEGTTIRVFSLSDAKCAPAIVYGDTLAQRDANATLIAAAPAMLEELHQCNRLSWWSENDRLTRDELQERLWKIRQITRNAIARAKTE